MAVVGDLVQGIDAAEHRYLDDPAASPMQDRDQLYARAQALVEPDNVDDLLTGNAELLAVHSRLERQWQHAHADQVGPVDALNRHSPDDAQFYGINTPILI